MIAGCCLRHYFHNLLIFFFAQLNQVPFFSRTTKTTLNKIKIKLPGSITKRQVLKYYRTEFLTELHQNKTTNPGKKIMASTIGFAESPEAAAEAATVAAKAAAKMAESPSSPKATATISSSSATAMAKICISSEEDKKINATCTNIPTLNNISQFDIEKYINQTAEHMLIVINHHQQQFNTNHPKGLTMFEEYSIFREQPLLFYLDDDIMSNISSTFFSVMKVKNKKLDRQFCRLVLMPYVIEFIYSSIFKIPQDKLEPTIRNIMNKKEDNNENVKFDNFESDIEMAGDNDDIIILHETINID